MAVWCSYTTKANIGGEQHNLPLGCFCGRPVGDMDGVGEGSPCLAVWYLTLREKMAVVFGRCVVDDTGDAVTNKGVV